MTLIKYAAIAALILFGLVLMLIGVLSVTHDTPV
jgi:L-asparagine transporter-like permease